MKRIIDNRPDQDHTMSYGRYCRSVLTDEYRAVLDGANLDWLVNQYVYWEGKDTVEADIIATAIMETADQIGVGSKFMILCDLAAG